jgi:hypothetical protein
MQHSITQIGKNYAGISELRKDKKPFIEADFVKFAENNKDKYGVHLECGELMVSTWYSNDLVQAYQKTL